VGLVHSRYKFSRRFLRRDNGFTLTELVIAMVVLGVIASIALPSFLGSRNNSYDKEAQTSIENVLKGAKFLYQSQGDFSDGSSAQCGDSTGLAADLQKLEPNVDVVASSVSSTNSRIVSVQAVQTWDSTGGLLGCQGFYAVALSSSGSCWAARLTIEGKFLASGSVSPVVVNTQTNTSNNAVTTWSALAVNGNAFGVLKPQTSAADGDNTNNLVAIKTACKARTQSTGVADLGGNYIAPSQFYSSWRDVVAAPYIATAANCVTTDTCAAGETGPGGGTVFYASTSTFTSVGSDCNTSCKYLEYAPIGWIVSTTPSGQTNCELAGTSSADPGCRMFGSGALATYSGTATAIGSGLANTNAIAATGSGATAGRAATVTRAFRGGGKSDWFLPSFDELNELCKYARQQTTGNTATQCTSANSLRTGFTSGYYWSSTEINGTLSYYQSFINGARGNRTKDERDSVRPVRAFG
jgi:prepilin-type N-terminal cleavage/methylation domain-containing protein